MPDTAQLFSSVNGVRLQAGARARLARHVVGSRIELVLSRAKRGGSRYYPFESDGDTILVYPAFDEPSPVVPRAGETVYLHWTEDPLRGGELCGVAARVSEVLAIGDTHRGSWLELADILYRLERRRAIRVPAADDDPLVARVWLDPEASPLEPAVVDVSVTGIRLQCTSDQAPASLAPGASVIVALHFDNDAACECAADVVFVRAREDRIEFALTLEPPPDGAPPPLARYVRRRERALLRERRSGSRDDPGQ